MDVRWLLTKKTKRWKKIIKRMKLVKPLYKNRKRLGTVAYSVIHLASGRRK